MATNFDPTKFGATPFNPLAQGASPVKRYDPRTDPENQRLIAEGQKAQRFLSQPKINQFVGAAINTAPKSVYQFAVETPLKFGKSVVEAGGTIASGGKSVPRLGGYVSQAQEALDQGARPFGLKAFVQPSVEASLAGLETLGATKLAVGGAKRVFSRSAQKQALSQTMSSLTPSEKATAGARTVTGSKLRGVKVVPTKYDNEVAKAAQPYVSKNIVKTENNLKAGIKEISEKRILPKINEYNEKLIDNYRDQIIKSIDDIRPTFLTKNDPVRGGVYRDFKERIISEVGNAKDTKGLFKARQILDDIADAETNGKIWEEGGRLNPIHELWRNARKVINGSINNVVPGLEEDIKLQHHLYDALEGVAEKIGKLAGKPGTAKTALRKAVKIGIYGTLGAGVAGGVAGVVSEGVRRLFRE